MRSPLARLRINSASICFFVTKAKQVLRLRLRMTGLAQSSTGNEIDTSAATSNSFILRGERKIINTSWAVFSSNIDGFLDIGNDLGTMCLGCFKNDARLLFIA